MKILLIEDDFVPNSIIRTARALRIASLYKSLDTEVIEKGKEDDDGFKHNRLMAGYHSVKASELNDEALKYQSGTEKSIHSSATEKKKEAKRHMMAAEEYREKAKKMWNKDTHGDWNSSIPSKADALAYGSKQSKEVDKNKVIEDDVLKSDITKSELIEQISFHRNDLQKLINVDGNDRSDRARFLKKQISLKENKLNEIKKSELSNAFEVLGIDIEKGGQGSGRKKIGITSTGKNIYLSFNKREHKEDHKNFTSEEHKEAAQKYNKMAEAASAGGNDDQAVEYHDNMHWHNELGRNKNKE